MDVNFLSHWYVERSGFAKYSSLRDTSRDSHPSYYESASRMDRDANHTNHTRRRGKIEIGHKI